MYFGPLSHCTWPPWPSAVISSLDDPLCSTLKPSLLLFLEIPILPVILIPRLLNVPKKFCPPPPPFIATSPFIRQIRVSSHFTVCSHAVEKQRTTFNVVLSIQAIGVHLPRKTNWVLGARMLGKLINCRRLLNPNWSCRARWLFDNMLYFTVCRLRLVIKLASSI